jgi:long-chain acyl-CoA synthetase
VITLEVLKERARVELQTVLTQEIDFFERNLQLLKPTDAMTICYTSGTTGTPKGVVLTHDNLMSVLEDCVQALGQSISCRNEVVLSFLPFSHILGRLESFAGHTFGWRQVFAESTDQLLVNMQEVQPTLLFTVPRIFEKAYDRVYAQLEESGAVKKGLFERALSAGKRVYSAQRSNRSPSILDLVELRSAQATLFKSVTQSLGGRLRFAICGGATLSRDVAEFFYILGVKVLEGYGLSETFAPVTLNTPQRTKYGTVGSPLPEVELKIGDESEILVRSRKVFKEYYKMKSETDHAIHDGWFYTGDIGQIDAEGYLQITDRKKDLIITSSGKNIAPQKIETLALQDVYLRQFVVIGEGKPYLTALIILESDKIIQYAEEHQILFSEYSELIKNSRIVNLIQKSVDNVNQKLSRFESIKKFMILSKDFTVEGGELTPSLKVRRALLLRQYQAKVNQMYE